MKNIVHNYTNRDGYWIDIVTTLHKKDGAEKVVKGTGRFVDGNKIGNLYVVFGDNWWQRFFMRALYKVVEVEYENHHIVYFRYLTWCFKLVDASIIYHRQANPTEEERTAIVKQASEITGIDIREFVRE